MEMKPMNLGVIGTGMISGAYLDTITGKFQILKLKKVADVAVEKARETAERYGAVPCTVEELLADPDIDVVLNLTPPTIHYRILRQILEAGKHAYTEKCFCMNTSEAKEIIELAKEKNLYVGSAPDTFFASWVQNARKLIDAGRIGMITSFAMVGNRDNNRMLSVMPYMNRPGGGLLLDYSVYYLTVLIHLLGPVRKVSGYIKAPYPTHVNTFELSPHLGETFDSPNESQIYTLMEMENGITGTMCLNADSCLFDQTYFALYGDKGIMYLGCPDWFNGELRIYDNTYEFENSDKPVRKLIDDAYPFKVNSRGVGLADMAWAIREGREPRINAERVYHVLDIQEMIVRSSEENGLFMNVASTCTRSLPVKPLETDEESCLRLR